MLRLIAGLSLGLVVGPGCAFFASDPKPLRFEATRSLATELTVVGIDSDHVGGLWIASMQYSPEYYAHDLVRVTHVDSAGAELARFEYNDEYTDIAGLAFSGDAVWLNYSVTGTGDHHVRKLDPATGATIGSFATGIGMVDLDVRGDQLLLSNLWNQLVAIDMTTGAVLSRDPINVMDDSTQRGIASTDDGTLWVASYAPRLYHLDEDHEVIETGFPQIERGSDNYQLAWDGTHVIIAIDHLISWLELP